MVELTRSSKRQDRYWFPGLLLIATLIQVAVSTARPMATYAALDSGMPVASLGWLAAAFAIGPVVFALSIGRHMDRFGERGFQAAAAAALFVAAAGIAFATTVPILVLSVALLGLAQLVFVVANQTAIATHTPMASYDHRFGHLAFTASLGQFIGPLMAGLIAADGSSESIRTALLVGALLALVAIPLSLGLQRIDPGRIGPDRIDLPVRPPLSSIFRIPGMFPAMLASLSVLSAVDVLVVFLPAFGYERGVGPSTIGALLAVMAAAAMASRLVLGPMVRWIGRDALMVASLASAAAAVVSLAFVPLPVMFVMMAIAGAALGVSQPLTMSWVATQAAPGSLSTAMSLRLLGNRAGQMLIPLAAGGLVGAIGTSGVMAAAGVTVAISAVVAAVRRERR